MRFILEFLIEVFLFLIIVNYIFVGTFFICDKFYTKEEFNKNLIPFYFLYNEGTKLYTERYNKLK